MKRLLKSLLSISFNFYCSGYVYGQVNLIPDGSFEDTTFDWQMYIGESALKQWHTLDSNMFVNNFALMSTNRINDTQIVKLPNNKYFNQYPKSGANAVAIANYINPLVLYFSTSIKSITRSKLSAKLVLGKQYCATINVSASEFPLNIYTNGLNLYFDNGGIDTMRSIHNDSSAAFTFITPQISCGFVLNDTTNWMKVQGVFMANGTEEYVTIGNFKHDSLIIKQNNWSGGTYPYQEILIDNVSLIPLDLKNWLQDVYVTAGDSVWVGLDPLDIPDAQWHQSTIKAIPFFTGPGFWYKPIEGAGATFIQGVEVCGAMVYDTMQVHVVPLSNYELGILNYELRVYPNPAKDVISVEQIFGNTIALLNVLGQVVQTQVVLNNKAQFNASNLPRGLYSVKGIKQVSKVLLE
jgi:hypothetical protein